MSASSRSTLLAAVVGLLLLGGLVVFATSLPDGDAASSDQDAAAGPIDLPDELPGGLLALDGDDLPEELTAQLTDLDQLQGQEDSAGARLTEVFGVPSAFRIYAAVDQSSVAQVTAVDKAPGVFLPDFPPIDPELIELTRPAVELVDAGDALCVVTWGQAVPAGQEVDETAPPQSLRCQQGAGERTYEIFGQGMTVDAAVEALDALVSA
ncbi:hypothetical protein [Nocardioides dongxiaopingii]|uniref:hypothetical protein n=1 Tax=Nocardioides dongxiaopingii TaxID=2576036 RepID=UPI0010C76BC8|nr:hypothetical protein [Nocardioides dongxiaopingii]